MTAWNSQATAICARLAFFGAESEDVGSSMISFESHITNGGVVAVDLNLRDVRGEWTQTRAWRDLNPQTQCTTRALRGYFLPT